MDIVDVVFSALFCFAMVLSLLGGLYVLVSFSTNAIRYIETKTKK